jgi:hypothetical protein
MSNFDFATDSRLSEAVYFSNNRDDTKVINGWRPIKVQRINDGDLSPTFGAQLYKNDQTGKGGFKHDVQQG